MESNKIIFHKIVFPCLIFVATIYALWEVYWASKVGSLFIKWHTHVALYFYLWLGSLIFLSILEKALSLKSLLNIKLLFSSFWTILLCIEIFLVFEGIGDTYMERINYGYVSRYGSKHEDFYRNYKPHETYHISRPEFDYVRHCNSLGFSDVEWNKPKTKNEKRILFLGDSFTEGVGAPFDSCYVSILRKIYLQKDSSITLMNAANSGDDPVVNFICYRDLLSSYHPDIIVQTLSSNDMNTDIIIKGGLERFQEDGTVKFKKAPWWEPIYALSYVSRLYFSALGYNELLIKSPFTTETIKELDKTAIQFFHTYSKEAKKNGTQIIVVLQPYQIELYDKKYEYNLKHVSSSISANENIKVVDLLPFYLDYFSNNRDSIKSYYWINDGHHNSKGYRLMAEAVKHNLDSLFSNINK